MIASKSKYSTRLNAARNEALEVVMNDLDTVLEEESIIRAEYEKKMLVLQSELCAQMSALSLKKSEIQSDAADIVSAVALKTLKPLGSKRMKRLEKAKTKLPAKPKKAVKSIVPYTQAHLTDALVHMVKCFFAGEKMSLRKSAALFMNNKYASLTRVWKNHRMPEVLKILTENEAIQFVANIPKPKVFFLFFACLCCVDVFKCFLFLFADWQSIMDKPCKSIPRNAYGKHD